MTRKNTREDAVSPVIGVMLMLVVTVVIAAVIAGFATGMAGDSTKTTPMALFEVEYLEVAGAEGKGKPNSLATFGLIHKGGDAIPLENIQITLERGHDPTYGLDGVISTVQANAAGAMNPLYSEITGKIQDFPMTVIGKGTYVGSGKNTIYKYKEVSVSAGDVLRIVPLQYDTVTINEETGKVGVSSLNSNTLVGLGTTVKWTLSYIPTNGIIASGEFEVPIIEA